MGGAGSIILSRRCYGLICTLSSGIALRGQPTDSRACAPHPDSAAREAPGRGGRAWPGRAADRRRRAAAALAGEAASGSCWRTIRRCWCTRRRRCAGSGWRRGPASTCSSCSPSCCPARPVPPTPRGLAAALDLPLPDGLEQAAALLPEIAETLLRHLAQGARACR